MEQTKILLKHGYELAQEINADIFLIFTETGKTYDVFKEYLKNSKKNLKEHKSDKLKIIVSTPNEDTYFRLKNEKGIIPILMNYRNRYKATMIKQSIVKLFENNLVKKGDLIVSILGIPKVSGGTDTISIINVDNHSPILKFHQYINSLDKIKGLVINEVLNIAMELGVEGREGKQIGTIFVVGDTENVLKMSSQLILNPFENHKAIIFDKKVKGTIKELSTIDGAFVITEKGEVKSAGRYIECTSGNLTIPLGLGARHHAAAAISKYTDAIAITVSESGGIVRVFKDGEILVEINPNRLDDENSYIC